MLAPQSMARTPEHGDDSNAWVVAQSYRNALNVRHQNQLHLHTYGVVALGFERLVFRHLGKGSESILCHDQTHTLLDKSTEPEFKP